MKDSVRQLSDAESVTIQELCNFEMRRNIEEDQPENSADQQENTVIPSDRDSNRPIRHHTSSNSQLRRRLPVGGPNRQERGSRQNRVPLSAAAARNRASRHMGWINIDREMYLRRRRDLSSGEQGSSDRQAPGNTQNISPSASSIFSSVMSDFSDVSATGRLAAASYGDGIPASVEPLLEMGFTRRHICMALRANNGDDRMNSIVTWLLEHPLADEEVYF